MDILINHPEVGSLWLENATIEIDELGKKWVSGEVWDDTERGCPYLPDDYTGEYITMGFPASCIRKYGGGK